MASIIDKYKLCLKIKLIGKSKLEIELIYVHPMALNDVSDKLDHNMFNDRSNDFYIWSLGNFFISEDVLKLPQKNKIQPNMISSFQFQTDFDRCNYLKRLYKSLQNWSRDVSIFKDKASSNNTKNISVNDKFWFII
jgi:hypothetical protein